MKRPLALLADRLTGQKADARDRIRFAIANATTAQLG
jgi:hypothetical protein